MATSSSSSNKLMEEINDQFLVCKICYDVYKNPKTLSCLHTFCAECLEKHQDAELERSYRYLLYSRAVSCPICRKKTDVPTGGIKRLPDNFLVANLSDVINRQKPTHKVAQCEICKSQGGESCTAVSKCLDCCKLMCRNCVELHKRTKVTQSHGLFDIEVEKDIICKFHPDEVVRFYCEPCEVCVCVLCTFQEHKGHEVSSFTEGIEKYRHSLDSLLVSCRGRITQLKEQLHIISKCEYDMKHTEEQITDMAIESIAAIRKKEREMVRDLYLAFGEDTLDFMKEKDFIQESIDSLQSTCNLTDIILKDKSIELLLLKKEIQEKLNVLLQRKWQSPPTQALQQVRFLPGNLMFGSLQIGALLPNKGDNVSIEEPVWQSVKYQAISVNTQTDIHNQHDMATTMGSLIQGYNNEQLTQTDFVIRKETGTVTSPDKPVMRTQCTLAIPDVRDRHTMTVGTPTMKRKIQTDAVAQSTQETSTTQLLYSCDNKSMNTQTADTKERATMTKIRKLRDQTTATQDLIMTSSNGTLTDTVSVQCCGTETVHFATYNKSTLTNKPYTADKRTATNKVILTTQETNTPSVHHEDVAVNAKLYGQDVAVSTRTIVTTNTSTGDSDVTVSDKNVATSWQEPFKNTAEKETSYDICNKDQSCMTIAPQSADQTTFTNYFNMCDNSSETEHKAFSSVHTSTQMIQMTDVPTNTELISYQNQAVHVDNIKEAKDVETLDEICQTMISLIDVMLWPSMMPVNRETNTEIGTPIDQGTSTYHPTFSDTSVNTNTQSTSDTGVGDGLCHTTDIGSNTIPVVKSTSDTSVSTERPVFKEQWCCTEQLSTAETGISTEKLAVVDSSHDAFRGHFSDVCTNTEVDLVIKPAVRISDASTNTTLREFIDAECTATAVMTDNTSETTPHTLRTATTNTEQKVMKESDTTMNSVSLVTDVYVSTKTIDVSSIGCDTTPVETHETITQTDKPKVNSQYTLTNTSSVDTKGTETNAVASRHFGMVTSIDTADIGMHTDCPYLEHKCTGMEPLLQSDAMVGTPTISSLSKGTSTIHKETKTAGTHTYVQNVEKATYMPQPVTITAGTSTPIVLTFNKTSSTDLIETCDTSSNTPVPRITHSETTMNSQAAVCHSGTATNSVEMVNASNDPIVAPVACQGTNTKHVEYRDAEAATKELISLSVGTTTHHRVACCDMVTETATLETRDQGTATQPAQGSDKCMMTRPEQKTVGILKKPHTVTRGTGTLRVKLSDSSTSPGIIQSLEQSTMTQSSSTVDKSVNVKPFGLITQSTSTPYISVADNSTEMVQHIIADRASSPIRNNLVDRASSPFDNPSCDRASSPIPQSISHKAIDVKPRMEDMHTSTIHVDFTTIGTSMPHIDQSERACSPIGDPFEKETLNRGTSMTQIIMKDEEMEAAPESADKAMDTERIVLVERASTPVRVPTQDQGIGAVVEMKSESIGTPQRTTEEKFTMIKQPKTIHSGTEMPQKLFVEKETGTPYIHTMHKNISTENMNMVDKQTNTADVTAAYRELVAPPKPYTVTRGTSMSHRTFVSKETSPPRQAKSVERASSPVKTIMIDKGVLVKKGEILEPVDTYQSVGNKTKPLRPVAERRNSKLESITEDAESSQDEETPQKEMQTFSALRPVPSRNTRSRMGVTGVTHKERFWPATPRMGKSAVSAFSVEGRTSTASILCRVETGTNTPGVKLQTKGTSTLHVGVADKAVCTESLSVENKMAECISKLRTVRQRLEQNQDGVYVQAPGQERCKTEMSFVGAARPNKAAMSVTMRSKSVSEKLNESEIEPFIGASKTSKTPASDKNSSSDESDGSMGKGKNNLARKLRLNINQLLRSSSLPEQENPPSSSAPLLKTRIHTVHPQVIPKLNIEDFKPKPRDKKDTSKDSKKHRHRTTTPSPAKDPPPRVPPRRRNSNGSELPKKHKDATDPEKKGSAPDPPARSSSLRHAFLLSKSTEGLLGSKKKEGSPIKK